MVSMTLDHDTRAVAVDRLGPDDLIETFAFLDRDPIVNVYLVALTLRDGLAHPRDTFWAARRDGEIAALLYLGPQSGAILPVGDDPAALRLLAEEARERLSTLPRRFQVIGPRAAAAPFLACFSDAGLTPRLELVRGAVAAVERAGRDQCFRPRPIERHAITLEVRSFVPRQTEPCEALTDRAHRFVRRPLPVGVLDAEDEAALVVAREQEAEQRGPGASEVQRSRGARRKAGADRHLRELIERLRTSQRAERGFETQRGRLHTDRAPGRARGRPARRSAFGTRGGKGTRCH